MPPNSPWHGLPNETPPAGESTAVWVVRGERSTVHPAIYEEPANNPPGRRWLTPDRSTSYNDVWGWRLREEGEDAPPEPEHIRAINPWCPDGTDHNWRRVEVETEPGLIETEPKCLKCGEVDDWGIRPIRLNA